MTVTSKSLSDIHYPDAILFDWDGTLVDSLPALFSYYNHVLAAFDKPLLTMEEARKRIRKSAREVFPEIFGDKADAALNIYFEFARKTHLDHLTPIDGADGFLENLHKQNIPIGVVSNKRDEFLQREVTTIGWAPYIKVAVGAGVVAHDKPAPDPIFHAIAAMGFSASHHIWYVGDTETDMQAAEAAGCAPIFIGHGLGTREDCQRVGVSPLFTANFADFLALVKKLAAAA